VDIIVRVPFSGLENWFNPVLDHSKQIDEMGTKNEMIKK